MRRSKHKQISCGYRTLYKGIGGALSAIRGSCHCHALRIRYTINQFCITKGGQAPNSPVSSNADNYDVLSFCSFVLFKQIDTQIEYYFST